MKRRFNEHKKRREMSDVLACPPGTPIASSNFWILCIEAGFADSCPWDEVLHKDMAWSLSRTTTQCEVDVLCHSGTCRRGSCLRIVG